MQRALKIFISTKSLSSIHINIYIMNTTKTTCAACGSKSHKRSNSKACVTYGMYIILYNK